MKIYTLAFTLMIAAIITSCSGIKETQTGKQEEKKTPDEILIQEIRLNVLELVAWIDLLPSSDNRFHISGKLEILSKPEYDIAMIKLKNINVTQAGNEIYSIIPSVKSDELKTYENKKHLTFSTIRGLLPHPDFNFNETIDLELIFSEGKNEFKYFIEKMSIQKAN